MQQEPLKSEKFWGIQPLKGTQFTNGDVSYKELDVIFERGELIGFLFEVTNKIGTLKIVKDNIVFNTLIENVPTPVYPFCSVLQTNVKFRLIKKPIYKHQII